MAEFTLTSNKAVGSHLQVDITAKGADYTRARPQTEQLHQMIDKTTLVDTVFERLKTLPVSYCLDLRTYKRNRSVMIAKLAEDDLLVVESGFFKERFRVK